MSNDKMPPLPKDESLRFGHTTPTLQAYARAYAAEQTRELLEALRKAHANAGNAEAVYQITKAAIAKATGE